MNDYIYFFPLKPQIMLFWIIFFGIIALLPLIIMFFLSKYYHWMVFFSQNIIIEKRFLFTEVFSRRNILFVYACLMFWNLLFALNCIINIVSLSAVIIKSNKTQFHLIKIIAIICKNIKWLFSIRFLVLLWISLSSESCTISRDP